MIVAATHKGISNIIILCPFLIGSREGQTSRLAAAI